MRIKDIASLTGLSVATVSRVINNNPNVSEDSKKIVLLAIEETGYVPNFLARNLRVSKTYKILLLLPSLSNPFYSKIIRGIQEQAKLFNYDVLVGGTDLEKSRELAYLDMLKTKQVDGCILFLSSIPKAELSALASEYPIVQCCEYTSGAKVSYVSINNEQAAFDATDMMIEKGCKNIAVIVGNMYFASESCRIRGYGRALSERGIPYNEMLTVNSSYSYQGGYNGIEELEHRGSPYDGVFCFSDTIAIGAIKKLQAIGAVVGKEKLVIGFDNISVSRFSSPTLSTIYQPRFDIGETAFELLMDKINDITSKTMGVLLPHKLISRESTGDIDCFKEIVKEDAYDENL